jgi:hypothetical protein
MSTFSRYISPSDMTVQVSRFDIRTRLQAGSSGRLHDIRQRPEAAETFSIELLTLFKPNRRAQYLLVSEQRGPQLGSKIQSFTFALQSVATRKGGSGPNRFHYDKSTLSHRPLKGCNKKKIESNRNGCANGIECQYFHTVICTLTLFMFSLIIRHYYVLYYIKVYFS